MAMIRCPECGNEMSTRAANCMKCGLSMSEIFVCPECGEVMLREGKSACSKCGYPIDQTTSSSSNVTQGYYSAKEDDASESDAKYIAIAERIIRKTFASNPPSGVGVYCESGNPISDRRKVDAVKTAFDIPESDHVFLIVSGNLMSGVDERMKGFAVTSHGVFFNDDHKKKGYYFLDEFVDVKVSKGFGYLKFGNYEFNLGLDLNKMVRVMNALQDETMKYL